MLWLSVKTLAMPVMASAYNGPTHVMVLGTTQFISSVSFFLVCACDHTNWSCSSWSFSVL